MREATAWLRRAAAALLLACCAGPVLAFSLPELMAALAQVPRGEARFTEVRHVAGLAEPLRASGTLSFEAPDRFVRRTLEPRTETLAVDGNTVTLSRGGRSRRVALDAVPEMVGIVEAVRGTLTGNQAALERWFRPTLTGRAQQWALSLDPTEPRLGEQVQRIRIEGRGSQLQQVEITLQGGDRSVMTITPLPTGAEPAAAR